MKIASVSLILICLGFSLTGQVRFTATSNAEKVIVDQNFEVSFTVFNARAPQDFKPPRFDNLKIIGPPAQSSRSSIINGRQSSSFSYIYNLRGIKVGKATIGKASIEVDGKTYETEPLTIEIVEGRPAGSDNDLKDIYYQAQSPVTEAYIGQQVAVDFNLYMQSDYIKERYAERNLPAFDGVFGELVNWYRVYQDVKEGVPYNIWTLRRFAVYPQRSGPLTIGAMNLDLDVSNRNDPMGLFSRPIRRVSLSTTPLIITGLPLPPGAPASFSGAVGQWRCSAQITKRALTTDEALSIQLSISGNGDGKRLENPVLQLSDSLVVYEPNLIKEATAAVNGELIYERILEYLITAKYPGTYQIPIEFSYFDPDSIKYIRVQPQVFTIQVSPGSGQAAVSPSQPELNPAAGRSFRPIKTQTALRAKGRYLAGSPLFWSLTALPFLLFGGFLVWQQRERQRAAVPESVRRRQRAEKEAYRRLAQARIHLEAREVTPFYDEVAHAMLGYVSHKLQIEHARLTKTNVREALQKIGLPADLEADFMEVMQTCEIARFSGGAQEGALQQTFEKAKNAITSIESLLKPK